MSQAISFQTQRLRVEDWRARLNHPVQRAALCDALIPVLTPAVLRHLPPPLQLTDQPNAMERWVEARAAESDVLTLCPKDSDDLLGLLILARFSAPDVDTIHIGYLLRQAAWGQGYASELLQGLVDWLRRSGQPVHLLGGVEAANPASAKVLQKNGFRRDAALSSQDVNMFRLTL